MAPWVASNLGKKVTMIYPDYAFGYDHRDFFSAAMQEQGGEVVELIADPADRDLLHPLPAAHPEGDRGALPRHGRPRRPHLRQGARRVLRLGRPPADLRLHRLARGGRHRRAPASSSSRARHFWEGQPRYKQPDAADVRDLLPRRGRRRRQRRRDRRRQGGLDLRPHVLRLGDALRHQAGDGGRRLPGPGRPPGLRRGDRGDDRLPASNEHPQGDKVFNGKTHQVFGHQHISKVEGGKLDVVHTTSIEDGLYPDEVDYTTMPF